MLVLAKKNAVFACSQRSFKYSYVFLHEPLVREIGQPLPTSTTLNKIPTYLPFDTPRRQRICMHCVPFIYFFHGPNPMNLHKPYHFRFRFCEKPAFSSQWERYKTKTMSESRNLKVRCFDLYKFIYSRTPLSRTWITRTTPLINLN